MAPVKNNAGAQRRVYVIITLISTLCFEVAVMLMSSDDQTEKSATWFDIMRVVIVVIVGALIVSSKRVEFTPSFIRWACLFIDCACVFLVVDLSCKLIVLCEWP